jgi:hypothetical protein
MMVVQIEKGASAARPRPVSKEANPVKMAADATLTICRYSADFNWDTMSRI